MRCTSGGDALQACAELADKIVSIRLHGGVAAADDDLNYAREQV